MVIWVFIDLVANSLNLCILGKLYKDQSGEFIHRNWGLKGYCLNLSYTDLLINFLVYHETNSGSVPAVLRALWNFF